MTKIVHEYDPDRYRACLTEVVAKAGKGSLTVEGLDAILAQYTANGAKPTLAIAVETKPAKQVIDQAARNEEIIADMTRSYLQGGRPINNANCREDAEVAAEYFIRLVGGEYQEAKQWKKKEDYTAEQRLYNSFGALTDFCTGNMDLFRKRQEYIPPELHKRLHNAAVKQLEETVFTNMYAASKIFFILAPSSNFYGLLKDNKLDQLLNSGRSRLTNEELEYVNTIGKPALLAYAQKRTF